MRVTSPVSPNSRHRRARRALIQYKPGKKMRTCLMTSSCFAMKVGADLGVGASVSVRRERRGSGAFEVDAGGCRRRD